jgi:hypothetical protein
VPQPYARRGIAAVPLGALDDDPGVRPSYHIVIGARAVARDHRRHAAARRIAAGVPDALAAAGDAAWSRAPVTGASPGRGMVSDPPAEAPTI